MDKDSKETLSQNIENLFKDENDKKQEKIVRNNKILNTKNIKSTIKVRRNKKSDGCSPTQVAGVRG